MVIERGIESRITYRICVLLAGSKTDRKRQQIISSKAFQGEKLFISDLPSYSFSREFIEACSWTEAKVPRGKADQRGIDPTKKEI